MNYEIFTDVSTDIDLQFSEAHNVKYVPMEYVLGEETFHCNAPESNEMMHEYYEKLRNKIPTQTSQISPYHYITVFEPYVKDKMPLLYLSLSSGLSNTYESALMAVQMLKEKYEEVNIEVVDTLGATGGMGILTESACKNREAGMELAENAKWLREHAATVRYWFMVEDLMYLKRGGRISSAAAVMGTALSLKPILHIAGDGTLDTIAKKRGSRLGLKYMLERFEATFDPNADGSIYICTADNMEAANHLKDAVLAAHPGVQVHITMLSPIIGAHTGPDMVSLIHYGMGRR